MDELVAFLTRCVDDDERVAREVGIPEWNEGCSWLADLRDPLPSQRRAYGLPKEWQLLSETDTRHIAHWDPARVLAEVKAKRRILELHSPVASHYADGRYVRDDTGDPECEYCASLCHSRSGLGCDQPDAPWPCPTVSLLAQPYAGQDGWREDWAL